MDKIKTQSTEAQSLTDSAITERQAQAAQAIIDNAKQHLKAPSQPFDYGNVIYLFTSASDFTAQSIIIQKDNETINRPLSTDEKVTILTWEADRLTKLNAK